MGGLILVSRWNDPGTRRREAVRAAHDQDLTALLELLEHYLKLKGRRRGDISPETLRKYALGVRHFLTYCGPGESGGSPRHEITRLSADDIDLWLAHLANQGLKPNAIALYLNSVRALYRALKWGGAADGNPAAEVKPVRDPTPAHLKKGALSPSLYRELLAAPEQRFGPDAPQRARDRLLLALGGSAGLRSMEICALDVDDLQLTMRQLVVREGKGKKRRAIPLSRQLVDTCARWLEVRTAMVIAGDVKRDEKALLVALDHNTLGQRLTPHGARFIVKGYYQRAGIPPEMWGLHTLRRTAGTHMYRATRDLHVVADVLGHASVNTSAIYAKMDMEVRREALEKMEALRDREE